MTLRVLGLIPARGGSKGVPGKNLRPLLGKSLIQRAHEVAVASGVLDRVILSTDDPEIRQHGLNIGLDAPFLRPSDLSGDESPMIAVVLHALGALAAEGYTPDAVMLLQPTSPLRSPNHLVKAVSLLESSDSVCSVIQIPSTLSPHYVMKIDGGRLQYFLEEGKLIKRRQDVPPAYTREGTVYLTRCDVLIKDRDFYGASCAPLVLSPVESLSIDTEADWQEAERRLRARESR